MKNFSKKQRVLILIGAVLIAAIVIIAVAARVLGQTNRTPKNAAKSAFEAVYGCNYDLFTKSTIYCEDCRTELVLDVEGFLQNSVKPMFDEMRAELEESKSRYLVDSAKAVEFGAGSDGYAEGVRLLLADYPEANTEAIEKVAKVTIEFRWEYTVDGETVRGKDSDEFWCYRVKGKWYASPTSIDM
ncbi:MAG: hypothetical protein IJM57_00915 [Lachnospiraceae bacterium]|nr:hypothetical protein [Lachnospiraceae bacterium]